MKVFKKIAMGITIMALLASLALASVGCGKEEPAIYVGNTAATTGAMAPVGEPFNVGIQAAFAAYNADGGFTGLDEDGNQLEKGLKVKFKHYDDGSDVNKASQYMDKLINEDEIFAVVGNFGSYAVNANLDIIKESGTPMVYAAAGNDELLNENATGADRGIFPVQPLNKTEGRMLIQRAFAAPSWNSTYSSNSGGFGATKVGVITDSTDASIAMTAGIKAEESNLTATQKEAILYQEIKSDDFSAAASAIKAANCDVVIITSTGVNFVSALTALANANVQCKALTTYNNASAAVFNDPSTSEMTQAGLTIFNNFAYTGIYAQGWLDIYDFTNVYNADTALVAAYKEMNVIYANGVPYFSNEYWAVAEDIYNYSIAAGRDDALQMSYDSFALAGYIAGDLFCQGLEALKAEGKALTQANYIDAMENKDSFKVAMGDTISFQNGMRAGVNTFSCTMFYDTFASDTSDNPKHSASSLTISPLTSLEAFRALIAD